MSRKERKIFNNQFNRIQINAAATLFTKTGLFETCPISKKTVSSEHEKELNQFAIEFKQWPIPEAALEKGLSELMEAIKKSLIEEGLLR